MFVRALTVLVTVVLHVRTYTPVYSNSKWIFLNQIRGSFDVLESSAAHIAYSRCERLSSAWFARETSRRVVPRAMSTRVHHIVFKSLPKERNCRTKRAQIISPASVFASRRPHKHWRVCVARTVLVFVEASIVFVRRALEIVASRLILASPNSWLERPAPRHAQAESNHHNPRPWSTSSFT